MSERDPTNPFQDRSEIQHVREKTYIKPAKWMSDAAEEICLQPPCMEGVEADEANYAGIIAKHFAALTPPATAGDARKAAGLVCRDIAELPDRTSPDDAPDMMLVTTDELTDIILRHFPPSAEAKPGLTEEEQDYIALLLEDEAKRIPRSYIALKLLAIITRLTTGGQKS